MKATILAALLLSASATGVEAQKTGVLLVAHGADSTWNAGVLAVAASTRAADRPVEVSFLMGGSAATTRFQDAVARLERSGAARIVVVPLLVSSYSGHFDQVRWLAGEQLALDGTMQHHLRMAGHDRARTALPITVAPALDAAEEMAEVLSDRARAMYPDLRERGVMIVGHGPNSAEDHAEWMRNLRVVAASVSRRTGARDVRVGVVRDDAPAAVRAEAVRGVRDLVELQRQATGKPVVVVPVLISRGGVSRDKLPADLAGLDIAYAGDPLLPHPAMERWVRRMVESAAAMGAAR